jgi:hypothetical protein
VRHFTTTELSRMQSTQDSAMQDTCQIGVYTRTYDTFGAPVPVYTYATAITCGYDPTGGRENWRRDMTALHVDATIRLPIDTSVNVKDRIKIITRFGVTLATPLVFEVIQETERGPSGLVLSLTEVTV